MTSRKNGARAAPAAKLAVAAALAFPMGSSALAQASDWAANERGAVRLVSAATATGDARHAELGLEFRLKPGWKTYWRTPGESGMPPRFDWSASFNAAEFSVTWPSPIRFTIGGMESYGYIERVVLPVRAEIASPGNPAEIKLHLRYAICREVCVPEEALLTLKLPAGAASATPHAAAIAEFKALGARPGETFGWAVADAAVVSSGEGAARRTKLVVEFTSRQAPFQAPELIVEGGEALQFGLSSAKISDEGRRVRLHAPLRRGGEKALRTDLALTLIDGQHQGTFSVRVGAGR